MKEKYGIKEYIEEYRQALEQKPETANVKPAKPQLLEMLKSKAQLGRQPPQGGTKV